MDITINPEELRAEIIESAASKIAASFEDGELVDLSARLEAIIEDAIVKKCDEAVTPIIENGVAAYSFQLTNRFGEAEGPQQTLTEYIVGRAEAWLHQEVDYEGKPIDHKDYYGRDKAQSRLTFLIDKSLQYRIRTALETAVAQVNKEIAPAIAETVKIQVDETVKSIVTKRR